MRLYRIYSGMSNSLRNYKVWCPLAIAAAFAGGMWIGKSLLSTSIDYNSPLGKVNRLVEMISENYVDDVDTDSLIEATLPDIMEKLDPHSVYIPAADLMAVNSELESSFSGVGIAFNRLNDTITVVEVVAGGPSERVGIMPGDRIVTIDDSTAVGRGWSDERVISTLRGPKDTVVRLGIKRNTSDSLLPFEVVRGDVPVTSVDAAYEVAPGVGYVKVNKFGRTTYEEFFQAVGTLKLQGINKFIIDLRGNGGGFMEMAIMMANEFLPQGSLIVSTRGRGINESQVVLSDGNGSFADSEIVVLLDEFSASASEIFAGAIQDNDRGVVIGRRSFGKGLVQQQYDMPDSSAVRLTIARYYTPSGRCIQKKFDRGKGNQYNADLLRRFNNGESYSADSIHLDSTSVYMTSRGRKVYGGGGIMPDIFVPSDTSGFTTYYLEVSNAGLIPKFAFNFFESNRKELTSATSLDELLSMLPSDTQLLKLFASYAARNGVPQPYWYIINQSRPWIVRNIKAAVARDALGMQASYEVFNKGDNTIAKAVEVLDNGVDSLLTPEEHAISDSAL